MPDRVSLWHSFTLHRQHAETSSLSECIHIAQRAFAQKHDAPDQSKFIYDEAHTAKLLESRKPMRSKLAPTRAAKHVRGEQAKKALSAIARGNGGSYRSPPTSLQIDGECNSDRGDWKDALKILAQTKFDTDAAHVEEMKHLLDELRSTVAADRFDVNAGGD